MNIAATLINRARSAPDRAALTWRDGTLSYGAFVGLAARIAGGLRGAHGLAAGDRCGPATSARSTSAAT